MCVRQFVIVKNDITLINKAVGIQHAGKGFCKNGFTGTRFAYDRNAFVFLDVQGYPADGREDSSPHTELDHQILNAQ